jgi:autotransporter-associated beta strand protein
MKNRRLSSLVLGSSLIVFTASTHAADIVKDNNTNALNLGTAWVGGTGPSATDVGLWNNTVSATNAAGSPTITALGADLSWQGIRIANVGGTANASSSTTGVQITNASSANTLTLGTAGIDMSAATQALLIQSKIALSGNQSWNVTNANTNGNPFGTSGGVINAGLGEDLVFASQASSTPMNLGGFTLGTSGTGAIAVTNGYAISNGTLNFANSNTWLQSGSSRQTSLASNLTVTVAANSNLRLRANSGGVNSAAPISVSGSGSKLQMEINNSGASMIQSGNLTLGNGSTLEHLVSTSGAFTVSSPSISTSGSIIWLVNGSGTPHANAVAVSGGLTGNGVIAFRNSATNINPAVTNSQVRLSGDNSGFSGSLTLDGTSGNRNLRLTTATAGSSAATWAVNAANILQVDGVAVSLGTLNGAGSVTNSHATNTAAISVGAGAFSGVISNGAPANGMALTKTGAGTLALTGANSYSGLTDVQAGTLTTTSAQTGAGAVTVSDSATFGVTQINDAATFNATTLTMGSTGGSTLELTPAAAPSAALVSAGTFTVNGSTTLRVKGLPVAGTTLVSYTTLNGTSGFAGLNLAMPFRINGTLGNTGSAITLATVEDETPKWRNGDGVWDINTSGNWKTSTTTTTTNYLEGGVGATDSVIFDDTSSGSSPITVTLNTTVSPVAITVTGTKDYIISGSGTISGTAGIIKNGSAALTLATNNTFSGGVLLNQGTLNVNHANALGSGVLTIAGGTTLDNTSGSAIVATNSQLWNGDFTFTGSNDLSLGAAAMSASRQITVNGGTLGVAGISGSGFGLTKTGAGTLAIGSSTYTGATIVNQGILKATSGTSFTTTSSITLADTTGVSVDLNGNSQTIGTITGGGTTGGDILLNGAVLTTGTATDNTFAGDLVGAGGLTKQGAGRLILSGDKSAYTGATNLTAGTLDLATINGYFGPTAIVTATPSASAASNSIIVGGGLFVQGNGTLNTGISGGGAGFGARGGNLTVNVGGAGAMIDRNSGGSNGLGQMIFGSATSDSKVIIQNVVGINNNGGTRDITVNPGTGTASAEIAGAIVPGTAGGVSGIVKQGTGELILSGLNTYIGNTLVNAGSLTLANGGQLAFKPTTNNTSNRILDASPVLLPTPALNSVSLNGSFAIDLSTAAVASGNTWTLVDAASVSAVHGATFSVVGFDDSDLDNIWTMADSFANRWSYSEATGVLSVVPSAYTIWITASSVPANQRGLLSDPDNDGLSNLEEYAIAGSDPAVANGSLGIFATGTLSFDKRQPLDADLTYVIEESDDLGISDPWAAVTPTVNSSTVISYTLPTAGEKLFTRLKVTLSVP